MTPPNDMARHTPQSTSSPPSSNSPFGSSPYRTPMKASEHRPGSSRITPPIVSRTQTTGDGRVPGGACGCAGPASVMTVRPAGRTAAAHRVPDEKAAAERDDQADAPQIQNQLKVWVARGEADEIACGDGLGRVKDGAHPWQQQQDAQGEQQRVNGGHRLLVRTAHGLSRGRFVACST